jgi:hypothetical protein
MGFARTKHRMRKAAEKAQKIRAKVTPSQQFAQEAAENSEKKPEVKLPAAYQKYSSVFDKKTSQRLPTRRPWAPVSATFMYQVMLGS